MDTKRRQVEEGIRSDEELGDTNKGLPQWRRELGVPRDSPEALKDCSTRPTFTTCKDRQTRGH